MKKSALGLKALLSDREKRQGCKKLRFYSPQNMPGGIPTGIFDAILNGFALACKTTAFGLQANAAGAGKSPVRFYLSFNDRSVCRKKGTAARKVRMSAAAIKYRMPSSPKNRGSSRPKTISRRVESRVENPALPKA